MCIHKRPKSLISKTFFFFNCFHQNGAMHFLLFKNNLNLNSTNPMFESIWESEIILPCCLKYALTLQNDFHFSKNQKMTPEKPKETTNIDPKLDLENLRLLELIPAVNRQPWLPPEFWWSCHWKPFQKKMKIFVWQN